MEAQDSSDEDEVEKDVAYLANSFRKFLNSKRMGSHLRRENSQISRRIKRTLRRRILKILLHLKWSRAMSAKGMGM